jgi:hypothetical protein
MASFSKRQKEKARQDKRVQKEARRQERKKALQERPRTSEGEDPDIAHIVPGPQPPPDDDLL